VAVVYGIYDRSHGLCGLLLAEELFLHDLIKQLPPSHQLHDQIVGTVIFEDFIQFHNVGVV